NTAGSSSAPAKNVRTMAPVPATNLIQDSSVCSMVAPTVAPMTSWATVPTTISESAVATRNQIETRVAKSASPSHNAACAQTAVMRSTWSADERLDAQLNECRGVDESLI